MSDIKSSATAAAQTLLRYGNSPGNYIDVDPAPVCFLKPKHIVMKKLKQTALELTGNKALTREQLKKVAGGRNGSNAFFCNNQCITDVDCPAGFLCILTDFGGGELCWRCGQLN